MSEEVVSKCYGYDPDANPSLAKALTVLSICNLHCVGLKTAIKKSSYIHIVHCQLNLKFIIINKAECSEARQQEVLASNFKPHLLIVSSFSPQK